MYSQFCYYIQQDEQKRRATMHLDRKPGEQIEVDWAGDAAQIIDPDTCKLVPAYLFMGVMTYSQYPYIEAFVNEKQRAWITAHMHMYEYFDAHQPSSVPNTTRVAGKISWAVTTALWRKPFWTGSNTMHTRLTLYPSIRPTTAP